jgi:hypothetical protein
MAGFATARKCIAADQGLYYHLLKPAMIAQKSHFFRAAR